MRSRKKRRRRARRRSPHHRRPENSPRAHPAPRPPAAMVKPSKNMGGKSTKKQLRAKGGVASRYTTRNAALNRLQLKLADFRRLCILKGIHPRCARGGVASLRAMVSASSSSSPSSRRRCASKAAATNDDHRIIIARRRRRRLFSPSADARSLPPPSPPRTLARPGNRKRNTRARGRRTTTSRTSTSSRTSRSSTSSARCARTSERSRRPRRVLITPVPVRPRRRGERRFLRTSLPGASLRPGSLGFNSRHTPLDAFQLRF